MKRSKVPQNVVLYSSQATALAEIARAKGFVNISQYMQARGVAHIARAEGVPVPEVPLELAHKPLARASLRDVQGLAQVIAATPALLEALAPLVAREIDTMTAPRPTSAPPPSERVPTETQLRPPPHYVGRAHG